MCPRSLPRRHVDRTCPIEAPPPGRGKAVISAMSSTKLWGRPNALCRVLSKCAGPSRAPDPSDAACRGPKQKSRQSTERDANSTEAVISSVSLLSREHFENFPVPAFLRTQRMLGIGIRCGRTSPPLDGYDALAPSAKAWVLVPYQS
jgi:hypothetical protein